jgi:hypothetical protein
MHTWVSKVHMSLQGSTIYDTLSEYIFVQLRKYLLFYMIGNWWRERIQPMSLPLRRPESTDWGETEGEICWVASSPFLASKMSSMETSSSYLNCRKKVKNLVWILRVDWQVLVIFRKTTDFSRVYPTKIWRRDLLKIYLIQCKIRKYPHL